MCEKRIDKRIIVKEKIDGEKVSKKKERKKKKKTLLKINLIFCTLICTSLKSINSHAVMKQSQMISPRCLPHVKFISSHTAVNIHGLASAERPPVVSTYSSLGSS
jgi:hypothetical protein